MTEQQQQMRSVIMVMAVIALLITSVAALFVLTSGDDQKAQPPAGDFILQSSSGPVSLEQFRGEVVLLFFGYTHCPDVCPTTLSNVAAALDVLSADELSHVQPLFITVDPARDTVEHLAEYVGFFHPKMIGLSGGEDAIRKAAEGFSVQFFKDDMADAGKGNYYMNHTSYLFLIDAKGEVADIMSDHTTPEDLAKAVRQYIPR